ncbi:hypothetical protein SBRCBS47491_007755 [Sporothrix bragantina]|uniref:Uncharacterized protein n=1 Tax=Sporothrix bragantina TaxID=671064 RepID=A0ABP0CGI1_9PEZI
MAPVPVTALTGSLLASSMTYSSRSRHAFSKPSSFLPSSPPLPTHITPALAVRRVARAFIDSFTKRDDGDDTDGTGSKHLNIVIPAIIGFFVLATIWGCTRDHFKKGGTWKAYFKGWGQAIFFLLLLTVFLPFTILGCCINSRRKKKANLAQAQRRRALGNFAAQPLQPANNPHNSREPPPPARPQMSLDPVVLMPDLPDQEDPDAVVKVERIVLPEPPLPIQQKNESTAEATAVMLDETNTAATYKTSP